MCCNACHDLTKKEIDTYVMDYVSFIRDASNEETEEKLERFAVYVAAVRRGLFLCLELSLSECKEFAKATSCV